MKNKIRTASVPDYGGPEKLRLIESHFPALEPHQVLIEVYAADINPVDIKIESGAFGDKPLNFPYTPGSDVAGIVREVGAKVSKFHEGDEVFGFIDVRRGGYSEFVATSPEFFILKPATASMVEAASLPLVGTTAWQGLFEHGGLKAGQKVLIHGASGGVGGMAVQLAKWKKAQVFATTSTENISYVRSLGADTVIDYKSQLFDEVAKEMDLVLDVVGGKTQEQSLNCLKRGGCLVSTVGISTAASAKKKEIRTAAMVMHPSVDVLEQLADLLDRHLIKTYVSQAFPLEQARLAQETLLGGDFPGKIVLNVNEFLH